jgi:hypothetical protein
LHEINLQKINILAGCHFIIETCRWGGHMTYFWIGAAIVPLVLISAALIVYLAFDELEDTGSW